MAPVVGALLVVGCGKTAPPPPPPIDVLVAEVVQQDVPVTGDWVGTTDGYINAQIRAKVQGYLLTQGVPGRLRRCKAGQLLFQIDPRQYQADLDQARRRPRAGQGEPAAEPAERRQRTRRSPRTAPSASGSSTTPSRTMRGQPGRGRSRQGNVEHAKLNLDWTKVTSPIDGVAGITPGADRRPDRRRRRC